MKRITTKKEDFCSPSEVRSYADDEHMLVHVWPSKEIYDDSKEGKIELRNLSLIRDAIVDTDLKKYR